MLLRVFPRFCLSVFLIASVVTIAAAQTTQRKTLLTGKVLDPNRAAIPGADIWISGNALPASSAVTDGNGEFTLLLPPGEYQVRAMAEGFAELTENVKLTGTKNSQSFELVLAVATSNATVTITDIAAYGINSISTATKTLTPLRDIPQSISVVSKEQIRDQAMASITDVVAYVPGVTSHQGENNRDQLVIRGNNTSADFFLNGVRDDVQYYRDLYNVERVEALKGPNSMLFGRGGGGGVINRVSKEAGFSALREFTFQGGSFGNKRFTTDLDQPVNNRLAFRLNGLYENSGSFRNGVDLERYGVNPTATIVVGPKTAVKLSYEYFHDGRVADRGIPSFHGRPLDVPKETFFGDPDNSRVRAGVNLVAANVDHQAGRFNIHNRTMFGDYDRFYQNYVPGAVNADKSFVSLTAYNNSTKRRNLFNQTDVTFNASTGKVRHNFLAGAEVGRQNTDNFRQSGFFNNTTTSILVPLSDTTIDVPVTFRQNATDANNHIKTNLGATYVQDQIAISRYLQVVTGVRLDYFDLQFHNNRSHQDLRRIDRLVSPRAGVIVKPVTSLSIYANYGVAYLPSSGDQFSSLTTITQQVKPEKFTNYELGAKWDVRRNLSLTTAVYRQDRTNTRANDPNDPARILQTGSQRTNGYELGLNGSITSRWTVAGGYAYQDAFITNATVSAAKGAQVGLVPHHSFSLWNSYKVHPRLGLGLGVIHRSDMFAAFDNMVVLPGYTRADAAVFFSVTERWRLQANIQNLFDMQYYLNADGNNNISPGASRGARVALIARF
jgi:catecholate siderophore receptor